MTRQDQHWQKSRNIVERLVVEGELELLTPAHFGSGDSDGLTDLTLLRDACDGSALLPGASIAGAVRNYWRERTLGYAVEEPANSELFGARRGRREDMEGHQSLLMVQDAIGPQPQVELRDGVKIDGATRTAEENKLFDIEVLKAGTRFPLRFELLIPSPQSGSRAALCRDLVVALKGLEDGEIGMGARKRRGLGQCQVKGWRVWRYDLSKSEGLLDWLADGRKDADWQGYPATVPAVQGQHLAEVLSRIFGPQGIDLQDLPDKRSRFEIEAHFSLEGSLLIRSGSGVTDIGPDAVQLHRTRVEQDETVTPEPVVPGASLAGVLRARALRIANTLTPDRVKAAQVVDEMFGLDPEDTDDERHWASRLVVQEALAAHVHTLVQNRIRIDRFTGGAMDNYLFNEAPVFGEADTDIALDLELRNPKSYEIGLLLLLLKDLWTGDLPLGGESGIGRGRLKGRSAKLVQTPNGRTWTITQAESGLVVSDGKSQDAQPGLQEFVTELNRQLAGGKP